MQFSVASAQPAETWPDASQFADQQAFAEDSASADSTGTELVVPSVFTPNGDGIYDQIEVLTDGITVYEFSVFTRTGTRVFHSLSPRIFWDGTNSAGNDLEEGVYYYVLEEEGDSAPYSSTGFIYLFR
ncbi:MAG: gliding motility-associated C-terminal domain-containing protein [Bacteroidetes bacterium]|nr:gliding motility-associated C-terminal domain-containing protein [Bacteroidota bacterium]